MSAYSFGKIVTDDPQKVMGAVKHLAASCIEVEFGIHEPGDEEIFNQSDLLKEPGVVFNIFTPGASDVIALCNEATKAGREAIRNSLGEASLPYSWEQARNVLIPEGVYNAVLGTRLGRFVDGLFQIKSASAAGFAIFDNGVDRIIEEAPKTCKSLIVRSLLVAWDMGSNALFAWKREPA
jgi:hypothetical protein